MNKKYDMEKMKDIYITPRVKYSRMDSCELMEGSLPPVFPQDSKRNDMMINDDEIGVEDYQQVNNPTVW